MAEALSLVERGWRGARECSLVLGAAGVRTTHLIKGALPREVQSLIRPAPLVRLRDVPRPLFRPIAWVLLAWGACRRRLRWVLVDNERTLRELQPWCRAFGVRAVFVRQTNEGYELLVDAQSVPLARIFGLAPG